MENKLKGGKSDTLSLKDIADKFDVPVTTIKKQIEKGIKVEMEHTSDKEKAREIATDHVSEFADYYDRLKDMEKKADNYWKAKGISEDSKSLIKRLLNENLNKRDSLNNLLLNFGFLTTLGFSQITKMGKDEEATNELTLMMQNIRKPIINGMPYVELVKDIKINSIELEKAINAHLSCAQEYELVQ